MFMNKEMNEMNRSDLFSDLYENGVSCVIEALDRQSIDLSDDEFEKLEDSFTKELQKLCRDMIHDLEHFGEVIAAKEVTKMISDPRRMQRYLNSIKEETK